MKILIAHPLLTFRLGVKKYLQYLSVEDITTVITPEQTLEALRGNPDTQCIILGHSEGFDGMTTIRSIKKMMDGKTKILFVDPNIDLLGKEARSAGADFVVETERLKHLLGPLLRQWKLIPS